MYKKTCSQKFHLRKRFITGLNTFPLVWVRARAIARLSWKGLNIAMLPDIISGDIKLEKLLSTRVFKRLVILVGCNLCYSWPVVK